MLKTNIPLHEVFVERNILDGIYTISRSLHTLLPPNSKIRIVDKLAEEIISYYPFENCQRIDAIVYNTKYKLLSEQINCAFFNLIVQLDKNKTIPITVIEEKDGYSLYWKIGSKYIEYNFHPYFETLDNYLENCEWKETAVAISFYHLKSDYLILESLLPRSEILSSRTITLNNFERRDPSTILYEGLHYCYKHGKKIKLSDLTTLCSMISLKGEELLYVD